MAPKTLLVFCDGTSKDGTLASDESNVFTQNSPQIVQGTHDTPPIYGGSLGTTSSRYATNVLRLARSVKSVDENGNKQIVFYQSGVGSETDFEGNTLGLQFGKKLVLQILGTTVASKIRDAYVFIAQNYEDGDDICLFGFSRGAYTARKLSGLIESIGLLTRQKLGKFFGIWLQLMNHEAPTIPPGTRRVNIKCVGVWDTVGSVLNEIDALSIVDTSLPATVKVALHALSMQENREQFLPTLWTVPPGGLKPGQVLKQVWFAGAHSDVGGGYEQHELADISLFWMAGEVQSFISLDLDFLRSYSRTHRDPWGTSQPHNAYVETHFLLRMPLIATIRPETRLQSEQITPQSVFHQSVMYSPQQLQSLEYMVTMDSIKKSFRDLIPPWEPEYPILNKFEEECRDHWKIRYGHSAGDISSSDDSPDILIQAQWNSLNGDPAASGISDDTIRAHWVSPVDGIIPSSTIVGGQEVGGDQLYVARASYQAGIHPGKTSSGYGKVLIGLDGKEIGFLLTTGALEVLVGDQSSVRWVPISGHFTSDQLDGAVPVPGGNEADGTVLYIARAALQRGGTHCGKVQVGGNARIPYGGVEELITQYQVLVYA